MKKCMIGAVIIVLCAAQSAFALTGRQIMEKSDALTKPNTSTSTVVMVIEKGGSTVDKEFELISKKAGPRDMALITFTRPSAIKFLTHSKKGAEDDQWLRLSSGKVKRISSSEKDKSFVNSHLYYEDLSSRNIDDYEYKYLGDKQAAGADCYVVESIKKKGERVYSKSVLYVRKSDFFVVRIDIYMKGGLHKYLENYEIKTVQGIITPMKAVMTMSDGSGKTTLNVKSVKYNMNLGDARFSKDAMR